MALLALRPAVVDFIDNVIYSRGREMRLENLDVRENSGLIDLTIKEVRDKTRIAVLAVQKQGRTLKPNPTGEEIVEGGDKLIVIGTREQLSSLEEAL